MKELLRMAIVTLTSDMGLADHYVASVKGAILALAPQATIVDISHDVRPFDINHAAYLLKSSWQNFPMGTIHVIGVRPELTMKSPHLVVHYMSHYFIAADNGIFSLLFDTMPEDIFEINLKNQSDWTFPMRSVFGTAAAHLSKGGPVEFLGRRITEVRKVHGDQVTIEENLIKGVVVHFDRFENVHTNIPQTLFDTHRANRSFTITLRLGTKAISKISADFTEVISGDHLAMWGSNGMMIIAVNHGASGHGGGAKSLLGAKINDVVRVEFYGNQNSKNDF